MIDLSRSIFLAMTKRPCTNECDQWTISLMSYITKFIVLILSSRSRNIIRPKIGQEECAFVKDKMTKNGRFMFRMISESIIKMQKHGHLYRIDYTKAFNKVLQKELFEILGKIYLFGKDGINLNL